eukprot:TRINITY_DN3038_c0_g2_i4.p1 TRINITY_DN3038_c0_g2~~TRINITY_DN3038_c0_g2_i4.p1  ORF type:complete len:107 (-),score=10.98 TRINITY_DN3038_c0_g2_i4:151-471(-)
MFNHPIDGLLPHSIRELKLGHRFCHTVNDLPSSLAYLQLGSNYSLPIQTLPPNVKLVQFIGYLYDSFAFNHPIDHLNANIEFRICHRAYKYNKLVLQTFPYVYSTK